VTAPAADAPVLDDEDLPPVVTTRRPRRGNLGRVVVASVLVADEAVAQRQQLGTRRFRVEGTVMPGTIRQDSGRLLFTILGDRGALVPIVHTGGQPTGLFKDSIPVVLEGRWEKVGDAYDSDTIIVKHSETYRAANPSRVESYPPSSGSPPAAPSS